MPDDHNKENYIASGFSRCHSLGWRMEKKRVSLPIFSSNHQQCVSMSAIACCVAVLSCLGLTLLFHLNSCSCSYLSLWPGTILTPYGEKKIESSFWITIEPEEGTKDATLYVHSSKVHTQRRIFWYVPLWHSRPAMEYVANKSKACLAPWFEHLNSIGMAFSLELEKKGKSLHDVQFKGFADRPDEDKVGQPLPVYIIESKNVDGGSCSSEENWSCHQSPRSTRRSSVLLGHFSPRQECCLQTNQRSRSESKRK